MRIDERQSSFRVNDILPMTGFFTQARYLRMQAASELEQRLGYGPGRLSLGWWLLFLTKLPGPGDFEYAGYTHWSGGVPRGHLPHPPDPRTAEQRLKDDGFDLTRLKAKTIAEQFTISGPQRLAKVIPRAAGSDYPVGTGISQWKLVNPLPFRIVEFIAPGRRYEGMYQ